MHLKSSDFKLMKKMTAKCTRVALRSLQSLTSIPQRDYFVAEGIHRDSKGSGKAKVRELQLEPRVNKQVLWLQVAVQSKPR
jgi:hypothetical protein